MNSKPLLISFFGLMALCGCRNADNGSELRKAVHKWETKREQITDSLKQCNNYVDSLVCLNRFAHRDAGHGAKVLNCDSLASISARHDWNAEVWYGYVLKDSISMLCGCNAAFFNALVQEFMLSSHIPHGYSIGVPEKVIGHYLSLIISVTDGKSKMHIFDPMFNAVYVLNNGRIADARHLIYLVRSNRTDLFQIATFPDQSSYLLASKAEIDSANPIYDISYPYVVERTENDSFPVKLRAKRTLDHYLTAEFAQTYREIADYHNGAKLAYTNTEEFKQCLLHRKAVYGPYQNAITKELDYFQTAPLDELDEIFAQHGLSVKDLSQ